MNTHHVPLANDTGHVSSVVYCFFEFIIKSIKREVKTRPIYDCRCDERLEPKDDESTCLAYTGLLEELEYLKIVTRLIDEKFPNVMGECMILEEPLIFLVLFKGTLSL
jgi:hypothetical protein